MNLEPKKDGGPNVDFFQSAESLQSFENVRVWLQKHHKKVREFTIENGFHYFFARSIIINTTLT
jgi:SWIRM-associated domain at the N-terminal